jgi:SAM-dependent methyltransferase
VLQLHDQDHYGGTAAVDRLMAEAGVMAADRVLDICSGLGGPARYLAWKTGCQVTGIDLTASRVAGATALTEAAGLAGRVQFRQGNALALPFADAGFTLAINQEVFAHIPNKPTLVAGIARVLQPGGRLVFSDILSRERLGDDDARRLFDGMRFSEIATEADYRGWGKSTSSATTGPTNTSSGCTAAVCWPARCSTHAATADAGFRSNAKTSVGARSALQLFALFRPSRGRRVSESAPVPRPSWRSGSSLTSRIRSPAILGRPPSRCSCRRAVSARCSARVATRGRRPHSRYAGCCPAWSVATR